MNEILQYLNIGILVSGTISLTGFFTLPGRRSTPDRLMACVILVLSIEAAYKLIK